MAKRAVSIAAAVILGLAAVWVSSGYRRYRQPVLRPTARLGCIRDYSAARHAAFEELVRQLEAHPETRKIIVEWKTGSFLDYLRSIPGTAYDDTLSRALLYDRAGTRFAMYEPVNGTTDFDWREVPPEVLISVHNRGEDFTNLSSYGCRSAFH
jgi:hypothetical protein